MKIIKKIKIIGLFLLLLSCKSIVNSINNNIAINKFNNYISIVENRENICPKEYDFAISNLENATKIYSYFEQSDYGNGIKMPVSYNIEDWKLWLKINKKHLRCKKDSLYTKGEVKGVEKNPKDLFLKYIYDLKKMTETNNYILYEISYILNRLEKITNYKGIRLSNKYNWRFPSKQDFIKLEQWFNKNESRLIWDVENHSIKLNK